MIASKTHLLFLSFFFQSTIDAFQPLDNILLSCGGNTAINLEDGRTFQPDTPPPPPGSNSSFLLSPISNNAVVVSLNPSDDLYGSARVFTEAAEYRFGINQKGKHFLRLHFKPISSSHYDLRSAVFSVSANVYTLLDNFTYLDLGLEQAIVVKEYAVEVDSLIVRFSPSNGSFAFISAIEVISVPNNLYPSNASPIPAGAAVEIHSNVAFETAYRVDMGGPVLDSKNDSLWRVWDTDQPFLVNAASARNVSTDPDSIRYPNGVPMEIAPDWVYATAQEMADANVGNQKFNISWVFGVDPGFSYLVRLHFCDFVSKVMHGLLLNVYINNQSALSSFDISAKTMGLLAAYFVDFLVDVKIERILVQVGPPEMTTIQPNAILNGLEIMKLSNSENSLDAAHGAVFADVKAAKWKRRAIIAGISCLGTVVLIGLLIATYCACYQRRKKTPTRILTWLPSPVALHTNSGNSGTKVSARSYASSGPSLLADQLLVFSEIQEATKDFDESLILGAGGFGKVYKGVLENGLVVAVKRGNPGSQQGLLEFRTEIEMLSKLRHRHLVSLIGYCHEPNEMVLVYEYMAGGPLRKHLYGSDLPTLSWKQRLEICIGAAKGLHYLHTGAAETIIHRDVKTTNILLDENLTAKVADFGLSKLGPTLDQTHVSTAVRGSFGYLDPEYFRRQRLTEKSDVYSFGVVLMEVLCARPVINPSLPRDQVNIVEWAMEKKKRGQLDQIIDHHLVGKMSMISLRKFVETVEKCLAEYGVERPTMGDVLWNLEYALQLQESFVRDVGEENNPNCVSELPEWIPPIEPLEQQSFSIVSGEGSDAATSGFFSQLMEPKGR